MSWQPGDRRVQPAGIDNWYAAPLAVDGAIAEPLRKLATTRVAVRTAVRGLLVRRLLSAPELLALRGAGVGPLEISQAFSALIEALPPAASRAGPLGIMIRAMARVARNVPDVATFGDEPAMMRAIGAAVAHALAEDLFPHPPAGADVSKPLRQAVHELLTARSITDATLGAIDPLERSLLASRLEQRLPFMRAVVPPARGAALERVVRITGVQLRRTPPVDAAALDAALAEGAAFPG